MSGNVFHNIRRNVRRVGNRIKGKYAKARGAEEQVHKRDQRNSTQQRAWEIFLRFLNFGAYKVQIFPSVICPERRRQRSEKRSEYAAIQRRWPDRVGRMC